MKTSGRWKENRNPDKNNNKNTPKIKIKLTRRYNLFNGMKMKKILPEIYLNFAQTLCVCIWYIPSRKEEIKLLMVSRKIKSL